jgi:UDP-N-acetylglucosamine acyltransferase
MQGGAAIGKDLPPFGAAAGRNSVVGINVIGLRRAGFGPDLRSEIKRAFSILYQEGLTTSQAVARADELAWSAEVRPFWDFVRTTKRGICAFARWSDIKAEGGFSED